MSVEERLLELGIELPEPPPPAGNYIGAVNVGNLLFLSGHGPRSASGEYSSGKLGSDLTLEQGQEEARKVGLNMLATLKAEIGDLDRVRRVVKVLYQGALIMTHRDGFPRLSARSAWRGDAGHRKPCAPSQSYGPSESLGKPPFRSPGRTGSGRIGAGVGKPRRCPASPAASLLPARWPVRSPARSLWVIISAPRYKAW